MRTVYLSKEQLDLFKDIVSRKVLEADDGHGDLREFPISKILEALKKADVSLDDLIQKKSAFIMLVQHEAKKQDCDQMRLFAQADLAARYELQIVDRLRESGNEGQDVQIALLSAASLLLQALAAHATANGNSRVAEVAKNMLSYSI